MVVGGGKQFGTLRPDDISLNPDRTALPHVVGSINRTKFPKNSFGSIYMEFIPYQVLLLKNVFRECRRLLVSGGSLVIITGSDCPFKEVIQKLRSLGFENACRSRDLHEVLESPWILKKGGSKELADLRGRFYAAIRANTSGETLEALR